MNNLKMMNTNNKYKLRITGVLLALLTLVSCSDFLDEDSRSAIVPDNFYKTETEAEAGLNGLYDILDNNSYHQQFGMSAIGDFAADNFSTNGASNFVVKTVNPFVYEADPANTRILDFYQAAYQLINRANALIARMEGSAISAEVKSTIGAEAKFLRAYSYFNLVRLFGDVVVRTEESTSLQGLELPRSATSEVYAQIILDLEEAESALPVTSAILGRATQGAAKSMLSLVLLTTGDFSGAASKAKEVMDNFNYSLFPNYGELFLTENVDEMIFAVQFNADIRTGYVNQITPAEISDFGAIQAYGSLDDDPFSLLDIYEEGDLRRDATIYDSIEWEGSFVNPEGLHFRKFAEEFLSQGVPEGEVGEINFPVLRYAEVLLIYAEALNELNSGPTSEAYQAINEVRSRAGLAGLVTGLSQSEFRDAILRERRVELMMEGKRWFDLKRMDRLAEFLTPLGWEPRNVIFPMPQSALEANKALKQNDGY